MKTAVISDIHVNDNAVYQVENGIINFLIENKIELLLIAGDIHTDYISVLNIIKNLEDKSGAIVRYVPGNHDLWTENYPHMTNDQVYEAYCRDEHCLCGRPFVADSHMIVGDTGCYDYSFGNPKYSEVEFGKMQKNDRVWRDSIQNQWTLDNVGKCRWFVNRLKEQLHEYRHDRLVLVTHMISHEYFKVPEHIGDWGYFNAFLGSRKLQELCSEYPIEYAICGHVHYRADYTDGHTKWLCRCLNYESEWKRPKDIVKQLESAFEIIEL